MWLINLTFYLAIPDLKIVGLAFLPGHVCVLQLSLLQLGKRKCLHHLQHRRIKLCVFGFRMGRSVSRVLVRLVWER